MTIQEIQSLTLSDLIDEVLNRLYDVNELPAGEVLYTLNADTSLPLMSRINLNPAYTLADIVLLQDTKDIIKLELSKVEEKRISDKAIADESMRKSDFESRLRLLKNIRQSAINIGKHKPNMEIEIHRIINENDLITLKELEAESILVDARDMISENIKIKKEIGRKQKIVCEECLNIVRGDNDTKVEADVDNMLISFSSIYDALIQNRPAKAKRLILLVPNDGIIDNLKQELLSELADGGY